MRNCLKLLTLSSLIAFGSGCATDHLVDVLPIGGRQELRKGSFALDVHNAAGSVSVQIVPGSEPIVRIRPVDATPGRRSAPVDLGKASFSRLPSGTKLTVRTNDRAGPVHVSIILPECRTLTIRNTDGPVDVRGELGGELGGIDIQNGSTGAFAHVTVDTESNLREPVAIQSGYGNINLHAGSDSAASISSHTPHGTTDATAAHMSLREVAFERGLFSGLLNKGEQVWKFDAANGSVRLTFDKPFAPLVK